MWQNILVKLQIWAKHLAAAQIQRKKKLLSNGKKLPKNDILNMIHDMENYSLLQSKLWIRNGIRICHNSLMTVIMKPFLFLPKSTQPH